MRSRDNSTVKTRGIKNASNFRILFWGGACRPPSAARRQRSLLSPLSTGEENRPPKYFLPDFSDVSDFFRLLLF